MFLSTLNQLIQVRTLNHKYMCVRAQTRFKWQSKRTQWVFDLSLCEHAQKDFFIYCAVLGISIPDSIYPSAAQFFMARNAAKTFKILVPLEVHLVFLKYLLIMECILVIEVLCNATLGQVQVVMLGD